MAQRDCDKISSTFQFFGMIKYSDFNTGTLPLNIEIQIDLWGLTTSQIRYNEQNTYLLACYASASSICTHEYIHVTYIHTYMTCTQ